MNNNIDKKMCTGCKACVQICPKGCIKMIEDKEGFAYPKIISEKCINCGLCRSVCPINKKNEEIKYKQQVYVLSVKNDEILQKSSSGGAFSAIAQAFCSNNNYVIFGVKYGDSFKVEHGYISDISKIDMFRKSKYVQSDINNSYVLARKFLNEGKNVLFTGTPCQIAGLKGYLNKEYENLLCIDLVCHGVPSQKVFDKYIKFIENKFKDKVKNIAFREKVCNNEKWNSKNIKIEFQNGETIIEDSTKNLYLKGYQNRLFYRPSCGICKFANPNRLSDITIADCWGIETLYSDRDMHKGQSMIVVNSQKGNEIVKKIKDVDIKLLSLEFAINNNSQFREPTDFHNNRQKFFKYIDKMNFDKLINKCIKKTNIVKRILRHTKNNILNYFTSKK